MTIPTAYRKAFQRSFMLISALFLLGACMPSEGETVTAVSTPVTTPTTLAAEPLTTARPTSEPTVTVTSQPAVTASLQPTATIPSPDENPPHSTPKPVITSEPTQTPTPFAGPWPPITHDLLIWADSWTYGTLKYWHHDSRELEVLISPVDSTGERDDDEPAPGGLTQLSVSLDGQTIVAGRVQNDDHTLREIVWFDRATLQPQTLVSDIPLLQEIAVSPDGRYVAYRTNESETNIESEMAILGFIFLREIGSNEPPMLIGKCLTREPEIRESGCISRTMIWHPNGETFHWTDEGRGIMAYDLSTGNETILQSHNLESSEYYERERYLPIDWSPNGRFLRVDVFRHEGGGEAILDTVTKQLFYIPNTGSYDRVERAYGTWLADNRYLLAQPEFIEAGEFKTMIEIWRPSSEAGQLILDGSIAMPTDPQAIPAQPFQFPDGAFAISILGRETTDPTAGIYRLDTLFSTPLQLNQIPDVEWIWYGDEIFWEPDGSGIIIEDSGEIIGGQYTKNGMVYIPTGETAAYDLIPIFGRNIVQFHWLP